MVGRVHLDLVRARVLVDLQDLLPRLAGIGRFVEAAVTARAEETALRRHEHDVVVLGVDRDAVDVERPIEAGVGERLAAVGRLPDAVAPRRALPVVAFTRANPDEVGVGLADRHGADRHQPLVLELGGERHAVVHRLPQAAVRGRDVEDVRPFLVHRERGDAPGHHGRADRPEVQAVELGSDGHTVHRPRWIGRRRLGVNEERRGAHNRERRQERQSVSGHGVKPDKRRGGV